MNIYFDTEFTGLNKNADLISIALISDNEKRFCAEFNDYDKSKCDDWIEENVIRKLLYSTDKQEELCATKVYGSKEEIREELEKWLKSFDQVQLIAAVCFYDMVLFIDISGNTYNLPYNISPSCHDIDQDIAKYYNISEKEAFDVSREQLAANCGMQDTARAMAIYKAIN